MNAAGAKPNALRTASMRVMLWRASMRSWAGVTGGLGSTLSMTIAAGISAATGTCTLMRMPAPMASWMMSMISS